MQPHLTTPRHRASSPRERRFRLDSLRDLLLLLLSGLACLPAFASTYSVSDVSNGTDSVPIGVTRPNWSGPFVVGNSSASPFQGYKYSLGWVFALPLPPPFIGADTVTGARATAVSGFNIVGTASTSGPSRALHWSQGQVLALPLPLFSSGMSADGLNNTGQIVGANYSQGMAKPLGYVFDTATQQYSFLPTNLLGGQGNVASAISDNGWIVGHFYLAPAIYHAFLWRQGLVWDLHDPNVLTGFFSQANAVNTGGVAVGSADIGSQPHAFLGYVPWLGQKPVVIDMGILPGTVSSEALAINAANTIVGHSDNKAFVYFNGAMHDLNSMIPANSGWVLKSATGIDDAGDIVGIGTFKGAWRAFRGGRSAAPSAGVLHVELFAVADCTHD